MSCFSNVSNSLLFTFFEGVDSVGLANLKTALCREAHVIPEIIIKKAALRDLNAATRAANETVDEAAYDQMGLYAKHLFQEKINAAALLASVLPSLAYTGAMDYAAVRYVKRPFLLPVEKSGAHHILQRGQTYLVCSSDEVFSRCYGMLSIGKIVFGDYETDDEDVTFRDAACMQSCMSNSNNGWFKKDRKIIKVGKRISRSPGQSDEVELIDLQQDWTLFRYPPIEQILQMLRMKPSRECNNALKEVM